EMNLVGLRKFSCVEIELFFGMCNKVKEEDSNKLYLSFEEVKYLSNYKYESRNVNGFIGDLENIYKKMVEISYGREDEDVIEFFVVLNEFKIDKREKYVEIWSNGELKFVLNDISGNFRKLELKEVSNLKCW
ncbi:replication initiation protein, partial [Staphylococcus epidermidis]|uniref:replication initiation protein n=1 Tax=Staphylococcus epidermidis TaxID=1282 RepID=UPI0021B4B798